MRPRWIRLPTMPAASGVLRGEGGQEAGGGHAVTGTASRGWALAHAHTPTSTHINPGTHHALPRGRPPPAHLVSLKPRKVPDST